MKDKLFQEELKNKIEVLELENKFLRESLANKKDLDKNFISKLLDTIPNPFFYKDINGIYQNCNDAFSKTILGIPKEIIIGKSLFDLPDYIPNSMAKIYYEKDAELFKTKGIQCYEGKVKCSDGITRYYSFYKVTVQDDKNKTIGIVGVMLDISELKNTQNEIFRTNKKLEELTYIDALTGAFNRRKFDEVTQKEILLSKEHKRPINFIILDLDNFKSYNDNYGHQKGDDVLKEISNTILNLLCRDDEYLFRLGGEEFGILYHSKDEYEALDFAKKVKKSIEDLNIEHKENSIYNRVTISLGLLTIQEDYKNISIIYSQTDALLYEAKNTGRNCIKYQTI